MEFEFQNATIGSLKTIIGLQNFFFFLKLDFEKIKFQKKGISLISLENGAKCFIICVKRAKANFVLFCNYDLINHIYPL